MDRPTALTPHDLTDAERDDLRALGYRPVEVWVRDRSDPAYRAEAERQSRAAAQADDDAMEWVAAVRGDPWEDE